MGIEVAERLHALPDLRIDFAEENPGYCRCGSLIYYTSPVTCGRNGQDRPV